jgi:hypothetical protein
MNAVVVQDLSLMNLRESAHAQDPSSPVLQVTPAQPEPDHHHDACISSHPRLTCCVQRAKSVGMLKLRQWQVAVMSLSTKLVLKPVCVLIQLQEDIFRSI